MPSSRASSSSDVLDGAVDLRSLPQRRHVTAHPFVEKLRIAVHFDFYAVSGLDLDGYHFGSGQSIDTDIPPAFLDAYYGDNLLDIDPFVQASKSASGVVIEKNVYAQTPPPRRLQYLTETFGVLNRTLFPVRRGDNVFGAVAFARKTAFADHELDFLVDVADVMHRVITRPIMDKFSAPTLRLIDGEIACLRSASFGKTTDEIAEVTGYTADTVNSYIKTAIRKLNASNRVHAIAEAIRRGLIH
ncbi:LuxR C-terminal-related transcriptional regulator [Rhizobium sp. NFR03]|uniref:helix-turn-helix transcriptional regulator n=1 Tax=Rhizobium sp. NFR03 TaxID=1566263 RepID=UPI0008C51260|nr:LuxR C-terminal-related transcriptional regulator [Rhizobium sp. NFR03]SES46982.1 LuxR family transcriptional regulator [Rhizobium sp. NFR03]